MTSQENYHLTPKLAFHNSRSVKCITWAQKLYQQGRFEIRNRELTFEGSRFPSNLKEDT